MSKLRSKSLNLPDQIPFVPDPGRGKTEKISGKRRGFYGELRGKINRSGMRTGRGKGTKFGRGVSRGSSGKLRQQVTVKARYQKHKGQGAKKGLRKHLQYISREGVDKEGGPAKLFGEAGEISKEIGLDSVEEWATDRHHWRLIISPERGEELDLNRFAQDFIEGMERDLGTKLQWIGTGHYDTENPHVHLLIRGKTDRGDDLVIKKGYVSYGMRDLAEELATKTLGHRQEWELLHDIRRGINKERLGKIDRKLLFEVRKSSDGVIDLKSQFNLADRELRNLKIRRLKFLRELGLARRVSQGKWQLSENMEKVLRELSIRGDIIKTMHAKMKDGRENILFDTREHADISGTVMHKGFIDPLGDKTFMLVEANDGRNYYVALSKYSEKDGAESSVGDVVCVSGAGFKERPIDQVIADLAKEGSGTLMRDEAFEYIKKNGKVRKSATPEGYLKNVERRLEALERRKIIKRIDESRWDIPKDFQEQIKRQRAQHVKITIERKRDGRTYRRTHKTKTKGRGI